MVLLIGGCSFLFGDKIITTRFRAWQRFPLLMPELFYPLSLCLSSFPPAGQTLITHLQSDAEGRALLWHYLVGGGTYFNENWKDYMEQSESIRAASAIAIYREASKLKGRNIDEEISINVTSHADAGGGEAITGYNYLGGSNKEVGDFHISGNAKVLSGCRIKFDLLYEFNDITDPNPKYYTDILKNAIAKTITFGNATSFKTRIWWQDTATKAPLTQDDVGWPLQKK